jgi:hypothetical protein
LNVERSSLHEDHLPHSLPGFGGGIRAVAIYAGELANLGHEVRVVSAGPRVPSWRSRIARLVKGRVVAPPVAKSHLDSIPNIQCTVLRKPGPIEARDVPDGDVVIATWWEDGRVGRAAARHQGRADVLRSAPRGRLHPQPVERVAATYRLPLAKICCASWLRDLMNTEYGDATADYVPYGVDHATFKARRAASRRGRRWVHVRPCLVQGCRRRDPRVRDRRQSLPTCAC